MLKLSLLSMSTECIGGEEMDALSDERTYTKAPKIAPVILLQSCTAAINDDQMNDMYMRNFERKCEAGGKFQEHDGHCNATLMQSDSLMYRYPKGVDIEGFQSPDLH